VQTDRKLQRSYGLRAARKYLLTPGGMRHYLAHFRRLPSTLKYHAQSAQKGQSCVTEVTPEHAEFLKDDQRG
jgi:hypothetical protein